VQDVDGRFPRDGARLVLAGVPVTFAPSTLPAHRVLSLAVRNDGGEAAVLHAGRVELFDDTGQPMRASTGFGRSRAATVGRATIPPGASLAIDLVWRARPHAGIPARVELGDAVIDLAGAAACGEAAARD
jgi:hypothetical protein